MTVCGRRGCGARERGERRERREGEGSEMWDFLPSGSAAPRTLRGISMLPLAPVGGRASVSQLPLCPPVAWAWGWWGQAMCWWVRTKA